MKTLLTLLLICTSVQASTFGIQQTDYDFLEEITDLEQILDQAEERATPGGKEILVKGRAMVRDGDIVLGSCWDYINALYDRAGYPSKKRITFFGSKFKGPYLEDATLIEPGDWMYFVNHSYHDGEHSGVFIEWTDYNTREAVVLSYPGGNRQSPGRYRTYILTNVYNTIRPKPLN